MKKFNVKPCIIEKECRRLIKKYGVERVEGIMKVLEKKEQYETCGIYLKIINEHKLELA